MKALRILGMVLFGLWFLNGCGHVIGAIFGLWPGREGVHAALGLIQAAIAYWLFSIVRTRHLLAQSAETSPSE